MVQEANDQDLVPETDRPESQPPPLPKPPPTQAGGSTTSAKQIVDPQRVAAEIDRQVRATERLTGETAENPVIYQKWLGYDNFKCKECPYASLYEPDVWIHYRVVHLIPTYQDRYIGAQSPPQ